MTQDRATGKSKHLASIAPLKFPFEPARVRLRAAGFFLTGESEMDYKELLAKYMKHVVDYEGATFVNVLNSGHCDVDFTDEEVEVLEEIEEGLE